MKTPMVYFLPQVVLCLCCVIHAGQAAPAAEFVQNFQGRPYDPHSFRPTGTNTRRAIQADSRGLRISPIDANSRLPVGLVANLGVRGDFEITMSFELLRLNKPTQGNGAGVSIYICTSSYNQAAATLGRFIHPDGEQNFLCHRATTPLGEERRHQGERFATTVGSGSLRLVRKGAVLSYQVAEGGSSAFQELYQTEWSGDDLEMVRFAAEHGGSPTSVDVLIKSVRVQADDFGAARAVPPPFRWTIGITMSLIAFFLATGSLWLWLRWRRAYFAR